MPKPNIPIGRNKLKNISLLNEEPSDPSTIDINLITLPPSQPRRYFDEEQLQQLTQSIKTHGILEPVLVRPLDDGKYELVAGERRYRSAKDAGLTTVPVSIKTLTDLEAKQITLIENLQRVDLNPVEETEGILELLSIELQQTVEEIVSLLYRVRSDFVKDKSDHNVMIQQIESVFNSLGLLNWQSFVTNRLPLLNLPPDILEILRQGKIAYTKAIALSKVKDEELRKEITQEAVEHNLSLRDLKAKIKELSEEQPKSEIQGTAEEVITLTLKEVRKAKLWEKEPKKWKKVEKLLKQINLLLIEE
jgi:ParB family chromosome partitioning protein